jgi:hypothetical protein
MRSLDTNPDTLLALTVLKIIWKHVSLEVSTKFLFYMLLDLISRKIFDEVHKSCTYSLQYFLNSPVTFSLLGPNVFLRTLFSNTFRLCSSLNRRDQDLHPYKTTCKITIARFQASAVV